MADDEGLEDAVDDIVDAITSTSVEDSTVSTVSVQGAEFVVEAGGSGPTLFLLIHGIGMGRRVFADLRAQLSAHGRVWAVDLPGYGEAAEPARTPTLERFADLIAELLESRGEERAVVIGHSMGAQIALELAVRHPSLVSHLVLAGPTVDPAARSVSGQVARLAQDLFVESPRVVVLGLREYLRAGPHLRRKFRAMLVHHPEDVAPAATVPTLVLRGGDDYVSPRRWCEQLVALLPDGRLVEIDGHGHETFIRDAAPAASRILEFTRD